jgi:hypothetical protein
MLSMMVTKHDDLLKKVHEEQVSKVLADISRSATPCAQKVSSHCNDESKTPVTHSSNSHNNDSALVRYQATAAVSHDQQVNKNNIILHTSPILFEDDSDVGKSIGQSELGLPNKDCSSTRVVPHIQHGITLAMSYADGTASGKGIFSISALFFPSCYTNHVSSFYFLRQTVIQILHVSFFVFLDAGSMPSDVNETNPPNVLSGHSTIEKRNRKKRKAKVLSPASPLSTLNLEPAVDNFYQKYLNYKFFKDT